MNEALPFHPLADTGRDQRIAGALLDHACADSRFAVVAAPGLDDDALDTVTVQELCEQQPGRPGADDRDLCPAGGDSRGHARSVVVSRSDPLTGAELFER